jgi:hypothetical protein
MDWSCINRRHLLHMATPVTGPDSVFFLWGFVKDNVYSRQLPKTLPELGRRISNAIENGTEDMLERV